MSGSKNKLLSCGLSLALLLAAAAPVCGASGTAVKTAAGADAAAALAGAAAHISEAAAAPGVAAVGGDWAVLGLARAGADVPDGYYDAYYDRVAAALSAGGGVLHPRKYTEYSRVILALTAIGRDVANVGGYNLLEKLADFQAVNWQGINGPVFALLALDSHDYTIPQAAGVKTQTTRELLIEAILKAEITAADGTVGGFSLAGDTPDPDITGMALQALARYQDRADVAAAIERALAALQALEAPDGGYNAGAQTSESLAQVIVGKAALFTGAGRDAFLADCGRQVDALLQYRLADYSFEHVLNQGSDQMSSEQGLLALTAYVRAAQGRPALYDMREVAIEPAEKAAAGTPAAAGIKVTINGEPVEFTADSGAPFLDENGRTLTPLRVTMERYGCTVDWEAAEKTAVVKKDGTTLKIPVGSPDIFFESAGARGSFTTDAPAKIAGGRTYLPIRAVLEAFGAEVQWDASTKTVVVK